MGETVVEEVDQAWIVYALGLVDVKLLQCFAIGRDFLYTTVTKLADFGTKV